MTNNPFEPQDLHRPPLQSPDPVEAAIRRHQDAREDLQRAAEAVDAADRASRQVEAEADAAFTAASAADGAAWADLLATRPGDVPGAVRLLRYVSASPASEVVEDPQDLLRQLTAAVEAAEAGGRADEEPSANLQKVSGEPDPVFAAIEAHRAAFSEWDRLSNARDAMAPDAPGYAEAMAATDGPFEREVAAFEALFTVRPTTLSGAKAWARYLVTAIQRTSVDAEPADGERALRTVSEVLDRLLGPGAADGAEPVDWQAPPPGFMASPAIEPFSFVRIPEGIAIELGRLRDIALAEVERRVEAGVTGEALERLRRSLHLDMLSKVGRGEGSFDVPPSAPRDWQAYAEKHPGFVPYPAHAPVTLVALDLAIRGEAERLLALAEEEIERRRRDYAGHPDLGVWPHFERELRREMRMEALAVVASASVEHAPSDLNALALISAIEAEWATWKALDAAHADDPALKASQARRDALLDAAATLPATTREARHAKALALAWMHYVSEWGSDRAYGDYGQDGRLALDIDAALGGAPAVARTDAALLALGPTIAAIIAAQDAVPSEREEAYEKIDTLLMAETRRLAEMRARTLDGLVLKARFVERGADEELKDGIVADLLAIGGGK